MSDKPDSKQGDLIPGAGNALTTRSSALVKRGLESLLALEPRIVRFPLDRSLGNYVIFDCDKFDPLRHPETFPFSQRRKQKESLRHRPGKCFTLKSNTVLIFLRSRMIS